MKSSISSILAACAVALVSLPAMADTGADLAKKNNCMSCHGVDKKIIGPAFKDVAKKYKGNNDAVALLSKKVKDGGSGVWGPIPMSPNKTISDADIKVMVEYVLSLN
ncbi:c-type cytochrome [Undibacterium macrobrachii]|jgi:cytochrome c|uniref:Cytochrome c551 n=1 Tax=Undibacterium macrobrachii TaxID=1119058 RepID=A0ABQ2XE24_9BURK|nr:cytochrome c551 [Undibacterium macrobrachii]